MRIDLLADSESYVAAVSNLQPVAKQFSQVIPISDITPRRLWEPITSGVASFPCYPHHSGDAKGLVPTSTRCEPIAKQLSQVTPFPSTALSKHITRALPKPWCEPIAKQLSQVTPFPSTALSKHITRALPKPWCEPIAKQLSQVTPFPSTALSKHITRALPKPWCEPISKQLSQITPISGTALPDLIPGALPKPHLEPIPELLPRVVAFTKPYGELYTSYFSHQHLARSSEEVDA